MINLVFASDWHVGFVIFDLFKAIRFGSRFNGSSTWGQITSSDDLGLVMTNDPVKDTWSAIALDTEIWISINGGTS